MPIRIFARQIDNTYCANGPGSGLVALVVLGEARDAIDQHDQRDV